jgi:septum formation topological specificity factor MinE
MLLRELFQQDEKTAVIAFGRLNPPTVGHAKLVEKIVSIPGDHFLFLSHTQKPKTDPLDFSTKLKFAQQFFPDITIGHPSVKTPVLALEYLQGQGYTDVIFVAGSDRVDGFQKLFDTYNGQPDKTGKIPFKFNSIRVVSAGERDPDADDVSGMSASKMRAAAAAGDLEAFAQGVPDKKLAKTMFDAVRRGMGVSESLADNQEFTVESRAFQSQKTPLQDLIAEYLFFTSFGQMGTQDYGKNNDSKEAIKAVQRTLAQSNKNLSTLDKSMLDRNKDKILNHIHDTMNYVIAHYREHLPPEYFDTKKKQINSVLTKYNAVSKNESVTESESIRYTKPQFEVEWEEAERYSEFQKIGKESWLNLVKTGKPQTITSAEDINNTDAADKNSFKSLDKNKQARALDQLKSGTVEMPIVAIYSDGWKELIGGNTRLTAMMAQNGQATVWAFEVPDEVAELAENFADGKKPGRKGLAKRSGVNTKANVSSLRKTAKNSSGEKQRMAHWLANMKSGKAKNK